MHIKGVCYNILSHQTHYHVSESQKRINNEGVIAIEKRLDNTLRPIGHIIKSRLSNVFFNILHPMNGYKIKNKKYVSCMV